MDPALSGRGCGARPGEKFQRKRFEAALSQLRRSIQTAEPDESFVESIGQVLCTLPKLSPHVWSLVSIMRSAVESDEAVDRLSGGPADVIAEIHREATVVAGAKRRVLDEPMYEAPAVAEALGSRSKNPSQFANSLRRRGELIGVRKGNRYLFPAFQFDLERARPIPVVKRVNILLGAAEDPWGVASWWLSPNGRLGGRRPADLAADDSAAESVERAARSVTAPIG